MGRVKVVVSFAPRGGRAPIHLMPDDLDALWEALLSADPARIRHVWGDLTDDESLAVLAHLRRMRDEEGWDPAQREAAATALTVLREQAQ